MSNPTIYGTVIDSDTFTRADQSGFGTASGGSTWSHPVGTATLSIASNEGKVTGQSARQIMLLGSQTADKCEGTVRLACSTTGDNGTGVILRSNSGGTNCYYAQIDPGSTLFAIGKIASGSGSDLATTSFTLTAATFYWIRFRAVGTSLFAKVWADGSSEPTSWTVTTTDSTYTSGQFGLRTFPGTSGANTQFDNFTVSGVSVTRTIPSTAALLQTSSRTITSTAALLQTNTRTIPSTASLDTGATTSTRTITSTAALLQTSTRAITSTAALLQTQTRTMSSTAALLQIGTRTIPSTAALLQTTARTITSTAALLQTSNRAISSTAALLQTNKRTIPSSASLGSSRVIPSTAALLQTLSRTIFSSAALASATVAPVVNAQLIYLQTPQLITASGNSGPLTVGNLGEIALDINITSNQGTSPTIQFFIERLGSDGVYYPIYDSTSISAAPMVKSASTGAGLGSAASFAGTIRVRWAIGGLSSPGWIYSLSLVGK